MFRKIIAFCCIVLAIVGCDRISQDVETPLIPRSVLQATSDRFCVSMNYTGDKIAYLTRKGKDIELRVEDLSGNLLRKFDVKECRSARNYCWATTGEHILIQQDNDGDENDHIICLDIKTGTSKDLTPFAGTKSGIDKLSKKYPHEIVIYSNKRDPKWDDAYRVNIITGKTELIFKNAEYTNFYFDHDFNLRVATKIVQGGDFEVYLIKNGKPEFLRKIPYEDAMHTRFHYFDADNVILYGGDLIGCDKRAFVAYNLQNKTSKVLFESDLADVRYFTGDPNTFAPQAFSVEYLKREIFVTDKSISKDIEYLKSRFDGKCFEINGRSYDDILYI
ncbi:MAG: hypothetical protein LBE95_03655 [Holosporaceae bacterium]|jgi:hypothetical protein|nr:hypothetical protein [Holosporaceae bacterium]